MNRYRNIEITRLAKADHIYHPCEICKRSTFAVRSTIYEDGEYIGCANGHYCNCNGIPSIKYIYQTWAPQFYHQIIGHWLQA